MVLSMEGEAKGIATMWRCRCKACEKECVVQQSHLKEYKSCGCLSKKGREAGMTISQTLHKNGTYYSALLDSRKLNGNNTSGARGVSKGQRKAYRAYINLRRKQVYLGEYDTLEEAVAARKEAEQKYYAPELEELEAEGIRVKGAYKPQKCKK